MNQTGYLTGVAVAFVWSAVATALILYATEGVLRRCCGGGSGGSRHLLLRVSEDDEELGAETPMFLQHHSQILKLKQRSFAKTGSGQTYEEHTVISRKWRGFCLPAGLDVAEYGQVALTNMTEEERARADAHLETSGAEPCFWRHLYTKTRNLPRQARDTHREKLKKSSVSAGAPFKRTPSYEQILRRVSSSEERRLSDLQTLHEHRVSVSGRQPPRPGGAAAAAGPPAMASGAGGGGGGGVREPLLQANTASTAGTIQ